MARAADGEFSGSQGLHEGPPQARRTAWDGRLAACVAAMLATWVMMSGVESRSPAALGLALTLRGARDFGQGAVIGFFLLSAVVAGMALLGWLVPASAVRPATAPSGSIAYIAFLLGVAALFEEIAVRGYPFQVIARAHGPVAAIGATSLVFAGLHGANPGAGWLSLGNTLLAGILLGVLYWRTLSLWLVTGVHFAWNWTMGVGAGLPVSGLHLDASLIGVTSTGRRNRRVVGTARKRAGCSPWVPSPGSSGR